MQSRFALSTVLKAVLAVLSVVLVTCVTFAQDVPHKVSYQGLLTDGSGVNPIADGDHVAKFTLYTDATGTTSFWSSTFHLTTAKGIFNVVLGDSGAPLPTPLMMPLWLGVSIENGPELRPLTQVVSAPYALGIADSTVSTDKIQNGAVTAPKMGQDFVGRVTLNRAQFQTQKGKDIDFVVGRNLNLSVDTTNGQVHAIIDALGGGTLNEVRVDAQGGLVITQQGNSFVTLAIASQGVQTYMIKDKSVTNDKLADGAVDSRTILDGSITGTDIASNTITGNNIKNGTITGVNIAIPLVLTRNTPGDVLDVDNTSDNIGGLPVAHFHSTQSSDGTPVMLLDGRIVNGPVLRVSNISTNSTGLEASSAGGPGVRAITTQTSNIGAPDYPNAVEGLAQTTVSGAAGVSGQATSGSASTQYGVTGVSNAGSNSAGVMGTYSGSSNTAAGVWGIGNPGWGVYATSTGRSAIRGSSSAAGWGGLHAQNTAAAGGNAILADVGGAGSTGVIVGLPGATAPATGIGIPATGVTVNASGTGVNIANNVGTGLVIGTTGTAGATIGATAGLVNVTINGTSGAANSANLLVNGAAASGVTVNNTGATGVTVSGQAANGTGVNVSVPTGGTGVVTTGGAIGHSSTGQTTTSYYGTNNSATNATADFANSNAGAGSALKAVSAGTSATGTFQNTSTGAALTATNASAGTPTATFSNTSATGSNTVRATSTSTTAPTLYANNNSAQISAPLATPPAGVAFFENSNIAGKSGSALTLRNSNGGGAPSNNYALVVTDGLVDFSATTTTVLAPNLAAQVNIVNNPVSTPVNGIDVQSNQLTSGTSAAYNASATVNWGLNIASASAIAARLNMSAAGAGTGILIGNVNAPLTGATVNATGTGLQIGATTAPTTGATVSATTTGATITTTGATSAGLTVSNGTSTGTTATFTNLGNGNTVVANGTSASVPTMVVTNNGGTASTAVNITGGGLALASTAGAITVSNNNVNTFGTIASSGNRVTINGIATPQGVGPVALAATDYELTVNGDANVTGTTQTAGLVAANVSITNSLTMPSPSTATFWDLTVSHNATFSGSGSTPTFGIASTVTSNILGTVNVGSSASPSAFTVVGNTLINNAAGVTNTTTIGNTTSSGIVAINAPARSAINVSGPTNVNTVGTETTSIGTAGGATNIGSASSTNTVLGSTTVTGATNVNTSGTALTQIGTAGGNLNVGSATSTNTVLGTTNINSTGAAGNTNIGVAASTNTVLGTTNVTGATNINTSGTATTQIGTAGGNTNVGGTGSLNTVVGATNINNTGTATTQIGTGGGATNIGAATSTNTVLGPTSINASNNQATNINTGSSTGTVTVGNNAATVNVAGTVGINSAATNTGTTTIGNTTAGGSVAINTLNTASTTVNSGAISITATNPSAAAGTVTIKSNGSDPISLNASGNGTTVIGSTATGGNVTISTAAASTTTVNSSTTINAPASNTALTVNGFSNKAISATNSSNTNATLNLSNAGGAGSYASSVSAGDNWLGGSTASFGSIGPNNLNTTYAHNLSISGNLLLIGNTTSFTVSTGVSPAITGKSTFPQGIGIRGISRPTTGANPGSGVVGMALNSTTQVDYELATNLPAGITTPTVTAGVMGVVENDQYYGGAFYNTNTGTNGNPNGIADTATAVAAFTADIRPTNATTNPAGRGILVSQLTAGQKLSTGVEVKNQNITGGNVSRIKRAFVVNSNGSYVDTGLVVDPVLYGVDIQAGLTTSPVLADDGTDGPMVVTNDFGVRVRPSNTGGNKLTTAGQVLDDGMIVSGVNSSAGAQITRGTTYESDAANNMTHGIKVGFTPSQNTWVGNAPQSGADVRFLGSNAVQTVGVPGNALTGNYGVRANTVQAGGVAFVGGDAFGAAANVLQEGAVLNATGVGVRIGTQFNTAGGSNNANTPSTGGNVTISNNGTGFTTTTVGGANTITMGYQAVNTSGAITTGTEVRTTSGAITDGNVVTTVTGGITRGVNVNTTGNSNITTGVRINSAGTGVSALGTGVDIQDNAGGNIGTGVNTVTTGGGSIGTGMNVTSSNGITTVGAQFLTTAGAINEGLVVAPATNNNITTNGLRIQVAGTGAIGTAGVNILSQATIPLGVNVNTSAGAGNITTGAQIQTNNGTIGTGVTVLTTSGAITTGYNVSSSGAAITTGLNVSAANTGLTTGANIVTTAGNINEGVVVAPVSGSNITTTGFRAQTAGAGTILTGAAILSASGAITTGYNVTSTAAAIGTGLNVSAANTGLTTGANIVTTAGNINEGVVVAPVSGSNITTTGFRAQTAGAGTIATGASVVSATGAITTGYNVTSTGAAIGTGLNVSAANTGLTTGANIVTTAGNINEGVVVAPASGSNVTTNGVRIQTAGAGTIATGVLVQSASGAITTGVNINPATSTVTTGVNIANVNSTGGTGVIANATGVVSSVGVNLGNTGRFNTGVRALTTSNNAAAGSYSATTNAGVYANNNFAVAAAVNQSVGVVGQIAGGTSTFAAMGALTPTPFTDFSTGVAGDGSAAAGNERPGVIGVSNSGMGAANNLGRGAIEAYNTGGGIGVASYSAGIPFLGITTGDYVTSTGVEGRSSSTTQGVGMVGGSFTAGTGATNAGAGVLGWASLSAADITGNVISRDIPNGMIAGVIGSNGSAAAGARIGVLGTDLAATTPTVLATTAYQVGVYGVSSGTTAGQTAAVLGEAVSNANAVTFKAITNAIGTTLDANVMTTGTVVSATGLTTGTGLLATSLTTGNGVNVGTNVSSGNGLVGSVAAAGTGAIVNATNNSANAAAAGVLVTNTAAGDGIRVVNNSTGEAIRVTNAGSPTNSVQIIGAAGQTITNAIKVTNNGGTITNGLTIDPVVNGINSTSTTRGAIFTVSGGSANPVGVEVAVSGGTTSNTGATFTSTSGAALPSTGATITSTAGGTAAGQGLTVTSNASGAGSTNVGLTVNALGGVTSNSGIVVNTAGGNDLTINEDQLLRNGTIALNTTATANAVIVTQGQLTLGTDIAGQNNIVFHDATNANTFTGSLTTVPALTANRTWSLPNVSGTIGVVPATAADFVWYGTTVQQTKDNNGNAMVTGRLFDVAYDATMAAAALGGRVTSTTTAGAATGMTIASTGTTTSTGNAVTSTVTGAAAGAVIGETVGSTASATSTGSVTGASVTATGGAASAATVGVSATATGSNASAVTGISASASGSSVANTASSLTVSGAGTTNIGENITVSGGTNNIGLNVNASTGTSTGIRVGNSAQSAVGLDVQAVTTGAVLNMTANGTGEIIKWQSASGSATVGLSLQMTNNQVAGSTGIDISGVNNSATGVNIVMTGTASGASVTVAGNGVAYSAQAVGAGTGYEATNVSSGYGVKSSLAGGASGTAIYANAGGATGHALEIASGDVKASSGTNHGAGGFGVSSQRFSDTYTVTAADGATSVFNIGNPLVTATSTIMITIEKGAAVYGYISGRTAGTGFQVTTSVNLAIGDLIHYIIINH